MQHNFSVTVTNGFFWKPVGTNKCQRNHKDSISTMPLTSILEVQSALSKILATFSHLMSINKILIWVLTLYNLVYSFSLSFALLDRDPYEKQTAKFKAETFLIEKVAFRQYRQMSQYSWDTESQTDKGWTKNHN